jgi:hypothetical protein
VRWLDEYDKFEEKTVSGRARVAVVSLVAVLLTALVGQVGAAVIVPDPIAVYHCEDVLPGPIHDSVMLPATAHDGIISGNIESVEAGKVGKGLDFTGGYFYSDSGPVTQGLSAITVAAWVKPDTATPSFFNISGGLKVYQDSSRLRAVAYWWEGSPDAIGVSVASSIKVPTDGQWHHLAVVYDKSIKGQYMLVYLDGQMVASNGGMAPLTLQAFSNTSTFGQKWASNLSNYDGQMDEIMVWDKGLTAAQVTEVMNIPEPATLALLVSGMGLLVFRRSRR